MIGHNVPLQVTLLLGAIRALITGKGLFVSVCQHVVLHISGDASGVGASRARVEPWVRRHGRDGSPWVRGLVWTTFNSPAGRLVGTSLLPAIVTPLDGMAISRFTVVRPCNFLIYGYKAYLQSYNDC